jgi:FtsZ-binding cell division protein ZapB
MFNIFASTKASSEKLVLPPLGKSKSKIADDAANETFGMEGDVPDDDSTDSFNDKTVEEDENGEAYDYRKPADFDAWIRAVDEQNTIYFYNVKTGESTWLSPCAKCCKPSDKYCVDCKKAFCNHDFMKRHEKKSRQKHHWQQTDIPNPAKLKPNEVFCIECSLKTGTLMCMDCFDPYCPQCFSIVHYVGALKHHIHQPYADAIKGWVRIRGETVKDPDTYSNGTTGVVTYVKPVEMMNPLERKLQRQFSKCEQLVKEAVDEIAALQFEVEQTKFQRDRTWEESNTTLKDLNAKHSEPPQEGNLLDHSKLKGGGFFTKIFGVNAKEQMYKDKLLNPTDRRRGESRTNYVKGVLKDAAGIVLEGDEEEG